MERFIPSTKAPARVTVQSDSGTSQPSKDGCTGAPPAFAVHEAAVHAHSLDVTATEIDLMKLDRLGLVAEPSVSAGPSTFPYSQLIGPIIQLVTGTRLRHAHRRGKATTHKGQKRDKARAKMAKASRKRNRR